MTCNPIIDTLQNAFSSSESHLIITLLLLIAEIRVDPVVAQDLCDGSVTCHLVRRVSCVTHLLHANALLAQQERAQRQVPLLHCQVQTSLASLPLLQQLKRVVFSTV